MENIEDRIQEMLIREAEEDGLTVEEIKQTLVEDWGVGGAWFITRHRASPEGGEVSNHKGIFDEVAVAR